MMSIYISVSPLPPRSVILGPLAAARLGCEHARESYGKNPLIIMDIVSAIRISTVGNESDNLRLRPSAQLDESRSVKNLIMSWQAPIEELSLASHCQQTPLPPTFAYIHPE